MSFASSCRTDLSTQLKVEVAQAGTRRGAIAAALTHLDLPVPGDPAGLLEGLGRIPDSVATISREALHRGGHESFFLARGRTTSQLPCPRWRVASPMGTQRKSWTRSRKKCTRP